MRLLAALAALTLLFSCAPAGPKATIIAVISSSCNICPMQKPALKAVERELKGRVTVEYYDMDNYEQYKAIERYGVRITPTLIFLDAKGAEFFRVDRLIGAPEIRAELARKGIK